MQKGLQKPLQGPSAISQRCTWQRKVRYQVLYRKLITRHAHDIYRSWHPNFWFQGITGQDMHWQPLVQVTKQALLVLQIVKWHFWWAICYSTGRLANRITRFNETKSSYFSKIVIKVNLEMKARLFDTNKLDLIIGFHATFRLPSNTNRVQEDRLWGSFPYQKRTCDRAKHSNVNVIVHHASCCIRQNRRNDNTETIYSTFPQR